MKGLLLSLLIIGTLSQSTGIFWASQTCSCDQLVIQSDCVLMGELCSWNGSSCDTQSCSSISSQSLCAYNLSCMWQNGSCTAFTFCSQLQGSTQNICLYQSYNCPYTDGTYCGSSNQLKSCSSLSASTYCEGYISQNGICFWIGGACVATSNCSSLNSGECSAMGKACSWQNSACVANQCSYYTTETACTYTLVSTYQLEYQLCQWDNTAGTCSAATSMSGLTSSNCLTSTQYTYRWVTSGTSGSCESCFGKLIQFILIGILIIFI